MRLQMDDMYSFLTAASRGIPVSASIENEVIAGEGNRFEGGRKKCRRFTANLPQKSLIGAYPIYSTFAVCRCGTSAGENRGNDVTDNGGLVGDYFYVIWQC